MAQKEEGGVTAQPRAVSEALTPSCEREEAPHLPWQATVHGVAKSQTGLSD